MVDVPAEVEEKVTEHWPDELVVQGEPTEPRVEVNETGMFDLKSRARTVIVEGWEMLTEVGFALSFSGGSKENLQLERQYPPETWE